MNRHHRRDPFNYPRDARHAFHMRETDYQRVVREAEARGLRVTGIYHSHVNADAYFSELDQEFASQPLFPFPGRASRRALGDRRARRAGDVIGAAAFRWLAEEARFEGRPVKPAVTVRRRRCSSRVARSRSRRAASGSASTSPSFPRSRSRSSTARARSPSGASS